MAGVVPPNATPAFSSTHGKEFIMALSAIDQAMGIEELAYVLGNIAEDDGKDVEDYTVAELVREAKHVLGLFHEGGTAQNDMLESEDSNERRCAQQQVKQLKAFIRRFGKR